MDGFYCRKLTATICLEMHNVLEALPAGGRIAAAVVLMMGIHACGWPVRICAGVLAGAAVGYFGYQKGSLSSSGAHAILHHPIFCQLPVRSFVTCP